MAKLSFYFLLLVGFFIPKMEFAQQPGEFMNSISKNSRIKYLMETPAELKFPSEEKREDFLTETKPYLPNAEVEAMLNKKPGSFKWEQSACNTVVCGSSEKDPKFSKDSDMHVNYVSTPIFDKTGLFAIVRIVEKYPYSDPNNMEQVVSTDFIYLFHFENGLWDYVATVGEMH